MIFKFAAIAFVLSSVTALAADFSNEMSVQIGAKAFAVGRDNAGNCTIENQKSRHVTKLALPAPCRLMRQGLRVQRHYYRGIGHVVYLVGPAASIDAFTNHPLIKAEDNCSILAQPIVISPRGRVNTRKIIENGIFCPNIGLDEKDFYAAAHEK